MHTDTYKCKAAALLPSAAGAAKETKASLKLAVQIEVPNSSKKITPHVLFPHHIISIIHEITEKGLTDRDVIIVLFNEIHRFWFVNISNVLCLVLKVATDEFVILSTSGHKYLQ